MKTKQKRLLRWSVSLLFTAMILLMGISSVQAAGEIGKTIDSTNVAQYKDLLIPAMFRAVEKGDFILPTVNLGFPYTHSQAFLTASEKNAGKFAVNSDGDLVDKATGKIPHYNIYGYPFPRIDRNDPQAADKIMWNFVFQKCRLMGIRITGRNSYINKDGKEHRYVQGDSYEFYLQGRPPGQEVNNPNNFKELDLTCVLEPMSMRGTNQMSWDYWDERDFNMFAYISVIRRIRKTSGTTRSDFNMGQDGWWDLWNGFSGKNRTMKWKLIGEKTILVPLTSTEKIMVQELGDGTIIDKKPTMKWGFDTPGWKGSPWAPTNAVFVPRQVWVIEQMPKDPYYSWGLHVNYVDKETNVIWYKEVNDKAGVFRTWVALYYHYGESPSGKNTVGFYDAMVVIDEKVHHATLYRRLPSPTTNQVYIPASRLNTDFFSVNHFLELSK